MRVTGAPGLPGAARDEPLGGPPAEGERSMRVQRVAAPVREQVLELLREAILDFRLKPGQRLIERELIEQTGVSRTTIREVLRQLAVEGLVMTTPHKGAIVVAPSREQAAEVYEVRAVLEALAARRFVERANDEQVRALRAAFAEVERLAAAGDLRAMLNAKDRFYDVLLEGAGGRSMRTIFAGLQARIRALRAASLSSPGRPVRAAGEMRAIVEAVEARDAEAAARACAAHVRAAAESGLAGAAPGEALLAAGGADASGRPVPARHD